MLNQSDDQEDEDEGELPEDWMVGCDRHHTKPKGAVRRRKRRVRSRISGR